MIIDVHCHIGFSARRVDDSTSRYAFERGGAAGAPGFDSYFAERLVARPAWFFVRRWLGVDPKLPIGPVLDEQIEAVYERHWSQTKCVDRMVLLAFDEYRDDDGNVIGPAAKGQRRGSDLYTSNSLVAARCRANPDRFLFGASIHPYRKENGRSAIDMLEELAAGDVKPALIKWLPIHQNIRAEDERTVAFLRKAAELRIPLLIHYGGEMSLSRQHMEFEHPGPMIGVLRKLRDGGRMPTVIVAHMATPSFPWQDRSGFRALVDAMCGEFRNAPLYGDISALAAFGRTGWLARVADDPVLQARAVYGSDFPIPVMLAAYWHRVSWATRKRIRALPSWIDQDVELKRAVGIAPEVFNQAAHVLGLEA